MFSGTRQLLRSLPLAFGTGCGAPDDSSDTRSWVEAAEGGCNIEGGCTTAAVGGVVVDSSTLGSGFGVKSAGEGDG